MNFLSSKTLDLNSVCNYEFFDNRNLSYTNQSDNFISSTTIGSIESASSDFYYVAFNGTLRKRKSIISTVNMEPTFTVNNEYETQNQNYHLSQLSDETGNTHSSEIESTISYFNPTYLANRWKYKNTSKYVYLYDADRKQQDITTQPMSYRSKRNEAIHNYTGDVNTFNDTMESSFTCNTSRRLNIIYASNWINLRTYINEIN